MPCSGQYGLDRSRLFAVALLCFLPACHPFLASQLQQEIYKYCSQFYAESTKETYKMHRNSNLCLVYLGYRPVPVQLNHLMQYDAFLALYV